MKYSPRNIILCGVSNYLNEATYDRLMAHLTKEFPKQDRKYIRIIQEYFDFEMMKTHPYHKEDIWIYNYLKYDYEGNKLKKLRLLSKYDREIIRQNDVSFRKELFWMNFPFNVYRYQPIPGRKPYKIFV